MEFKQFSNTPPKFQSFLTVVDSVININFELQNKVPVNVRWTLQGLESKQPFIVINHPYHLLNPNKNMKWHTNVTHLSRYKRPESAQSEITLIVEYYSVYYETTGNYDLKKSTTKKMLLDWEKLKITDL